MPINKNARKSLADNLNLIFHLAGKYYGLLATGLGSMTAGFGVSIGFLSGVGFVIAFVFDPAVGFGDGLGRTCVGTVAVVFDVAAAALLFVSGVTAETSAEIAPLAQICARLPLFISNSITLRFGFNGTAGGVIAFPFIVSCTKEASDLE